MTVRVRFEVEFHGPFRVSTGVAAAGFDSVGDPSCPVPASVLKGSARHSAEYVLGIDRRHLESIFGSERSASNWEWSDLEFAGPIEFSASASVAIDPSTGTSAMRALRFSQDMWYAGEASFMVESHLSGAELELEALLLCAAHHSVRSLGENRNRGLGWVSIRTIELSGVSSASGGDVSSSAFIDRLVAAVTSARVIISSPGNEFRQSPRPHAPVALTASDSDLVTSKCTLITITVESLSPLYLGDSPQVGNHRSSAKFISGSTLRGALARRWFDAHDDEMVDRKLFTELFDRAVRWPALHPQETIRVPLSVQRCKYRPTPKCFSTAIDVAFQIDDFDIGEANARCSECDGPLELVKGELIARDEASNVARMSRTSVSLDRDEVAADGNLFTRDGISKGTVLVGTATAISATLSGAAIEWIEGLKGTMLRVGGRRSIAGSVRITDVTVSGQDVGGIPAGSDVALRLHSGAIVVDEFGSNSLHAADILRLSALDADLRGRAFLRPISVGGWNMLTGTARPVDTAVAPGSTIVVRLRRDHTPEELADLRRRGIGTRQPEGFGDVLLELNPWRMPESETPHLSATRTSADPIERVLRASCRQLVDQCRLIASAADLSNDLDRRRAADEELDWIVGRLREHALQLRRTSNAAGIDVAELESLSRIRSMDAELRVRLVDVVSDRVTHGEISQVAVLVRDLMLTRAREVERGTD